jgi:hypothetical protein
MEIYNYGYTPIRENIDAYIASLGNAYQDDVEYLVATDDNRDTFLWRATVACLLRCDPRIQKKWLYTNEAGYTSLHSYNQGQIGSCVGNAEAMVLSTELSVDIMMGRMPFLYTTMASAESCYALSREAGNMLGGGDGSYGSAAAESSVKLGCLWMQPYQGVDLSEYSVSLCREWGRGGVPANLKPIAAQTKLQSSYAIKKVDEAWAIIGAGHPINMCSQLGFDKRRDSDGASKQTGGWSHSMALIGRRTTASGRKLFICINSWGEDWVSGPVFEDQPQGSFGIDYEVVDVALRGADTFVKVSMDGIKRKTLDWSDI